ncbi:glycosyltransferase family 1 protein [Paenibacillus elgii]|uniref:glycosyltransferase family 4 protein n=1 Tax=Paenibacillus elgii TaxID=189691 RepID=UPI002D7B2CE0|nr:glycosyltransferase family 1 protein [Paenibacillus elgii]
MKVSIDARMVNSSGIGTYIKNIVPLIIQKNPQYDFYLLGEKKVLEAQCWDNTNIKIIEMKSKIYSINEQFEFMKKIPKDTDLFWSPHFNIPIFYKGKLLVTIHDLFHIANSQDTSLLQKIYAQTFFKILKQKANRIVFVSNFTAKEFQKYLGTKANDKTKVIHIGVNQSWHTFENNESKPHDKPFILYVGNVKPHKNLISLFQAYEKIVNIVDHDLIIIGKKEGFITGDKDIEIKAKQLGERVRFTGYIDEAELKNFFVNADALVFPSLYEGFGLPPLEAMAIGCPAVVSSAASIPEVCGDAAVYFDPLNVQDIAEKILIVLKDNKLKNELISKGRIRAKSFTWESCANKTNKIIGEILNESSNYS